MNWIATVFHAISQPFRWWFVVAPWEAALRIRGGKRAKLCGPGIHFRIPFLDRVYCQSLRLRTCSDSGITMTTADGKVVTIGIAVEFAIRNLMDLYESLTWPETVLLIRVNGEISRLVATTPSEKLTPAMIESIDFGVPEGWGLARVRVNAGLEPCRAGALAN